MTRPVLSLVDALSTRAQEADTELYRFCSAPDVDPCPIGVHELDRRARRLAVALRQRVPADGRVLILCDFGTDFPVAFFACLYAGVAAVPAFPPDGTRSASAIARVRHIAIDADPHLVIVSDAMGSELLERAPELDALEVVSLAAFEAPLAEGLEHEWRRPADLEQRTAFLQYTSGSTRLPRGVVITHANLAEHQARAHEVFQSEPGSTTVSWLPFYHDMGLIGAMLYPLWCGGRGVFLPPTSFLRRPLWWLRTISETRARTSCAPNFAYEVATRRATDEDIAGLDLSCWEITVCGAEPVRAETMRAFVDRFAPAGFRAETFLPCFGLAEATLVGTASKVASRPVAHHFDSEALLRGEAIERPPGEARRTEAHVACGRATRGHEVRVVDPDSCEGLGSGRVGEIWMRGPSVSRAYFGRPEESEVRLDARIEAALADPGHASDADASGWMRSGDVGFFHGDELYVLGRLVDFIHRGERFISPSRFEACINEAGLRGLSSEAVAFVAPDGRERAAPTPENPEPADPPARFIVAIEARRLEEDAARLLCEEIAARVREDSGEQVDRVLLLPPRSIAKTSSGKLRRFRYRELFADGTLPIRYEWRAEEAGRNAHRIGA